MSYQIPLYQFPGKCYSRFRYIILRYIKILLILIIWDEEIACCASACPPRQYARVVDMRNITTDADKFSGHVWLRLRDAQRRRGRIFHSLQHSATERDTSSDTRSIWKNYNSIFIGPCRRRLRLVNETPTLVEINIIHYPLQYSS